MMFSFGLTALSFAASVIASPQYNYPPPPPSNPSPSSSAAASVPSAPPSTAGSVNIDVAAGGNFVFNPNNVTAPNGTVVTFFFQPGLAHSVTQSSFADPCTFLAASNGSSGGFDSGLQTSVQFSITITDDTKPIWFHCKQLGHCGMGMVGAINAPTSGSNTFDQFMSAAKAIGGSEVTETDKGFVSGGVNAIASAAPSATVTASASSGSGGTTANTNTSGAVRRGVGAAIAATVCAAIFLAIA